MSDAAITTLCTSAVTIVLAVVGFLTLWLKAKEAEAANAANKKTLAGVKEDVATIHKATNSMQTQLITATGQAAYSAGADAERAKASEPAGPVQADTLAAAILATAKLAGEKVVADAMRAAEKVVADAKLHAAEMLKAVGPPPPATLPKAL